jgi:hypothetical protein
VNLEALTAAPSARDVLPKLLKVIEDLTARVKELEEKAK